MTLKSEICALVTSLKTTCVYCYSKIYFLLVISDLRSILLHDSIIGYISEASTPSTNHELNSNSCDENCQSYLEDPFPPSMCQSLMSEYKHVQGNENSKAKYHRDKEASTPYQMKV